MKTNIVTGSGDKDKDIKALQAASDDLASSGGGTVGIEGIVRFDARWQLGNYPISLRGFSQDATLEGTGPTAQVGWGNWYDPYLDTADVPFGGVNAFDCQFENPVDLGLQPGDHFAVYSDDNLTGMPPHMSFQRPLEIHQVKEIRNGKVLFDDFVTSDIKTNPRIVKITMIPGVTVADLKLKYSGEGENTRFFDFRKIRGLRIENVEVEHGGPGPCVVNACMDVDIEGFDCQGRHNYDLGYGYHLVVGGAVNGLRFRDSFVQGVRHVFTTTGTTGTGENFRARWGTPRNIEVNNVTAKQNGRPTGGMAMFDTHAEGWGIRFINCRAIVPDEMMNRGFNIRARATELIGCRVDGGGVVRGISIYADDCLVQGGSVTNCWLGIVMENLRTAKNCRIQGISLSDCTGAAIAVYDAFDLSVLGCAMTGNGKDGIRYGEGPEKAKSLVYLAGGSKLHFQGNDMRKRENDCSIWMKEEAQAQMVSAIGNGMQGYGPSSSGTVPVFMPFNYMD